MNRCQTFAIAVAMHVELCQRGQFHSIQIPSPPIRGTGWRDESLARNTLRLFGTNFVPVPRNVPSSKASGFAAREGRGEGAEKHRNFPLTLTLFPPSNVQKK
jgi:hypothetical protein